MSKAQPMPVVDMDRFTLEGQLYTAKAVARRLFAALHACNGYLLGRVFDYSDPEIARILDPVFDAALILQERHRIYVEPCRRTVETHDQMYLALYPNGEQRNITLDQLMMMAGQEPPIPGARLSFWDGGLAP